MNLLQVTVITMNNEIINKVILELIKEFRGDRTKSSNEPKDLFKGIPVEKVHQDKFYFEEYVNENGEAVVNIYTKKDDGSKGKFIKTVLSDLLRIEDNKMHTGFKNKKSVSIK